MNKPVLFNSDMSSKDREYIFRQASERIGLPAYIIEKDYIVCIVLSIIFEDLKPKCSNETDTPFLFKGGTTLSKVYDIINRMSEDIDLSVSMQFLGYPEPAEETNSARTRRVEQLLKSNIDFISSTFKNSLNSELFKIHMDFTVQVDTSEPQNIIVNYPRSLGESDYVNGYIKPHVLIETGGRASFIPYESREISPFALDEIRKNLKVEIDFLTTVDVLDIERTFFEKLTLLHELNNRGLESLGSRQARHIYDVIQIFKSYPKVVNNLSLLKDVKEHKEKYFRRKTANWDLAVPGSLYITPPIDIEEALNEDWNKMADLFPQGYLPYSFTEMIYVLKEIDRLINY